MFKFKVRKLLFDIFVFLFKKLNSIVGKKKDYTYYYSKWFSILKKVFRIKFAFRTENYSIEYNPVYDGIGWPIYFTGSFEKDELECCKNFINNSSVIFDIGANIGLHTVHYASLAKQGVVYAFEPSKYTYQILQKNSEQFDNIITSNFAIAKQNSISDFYESENDALSGLKNTNRAPIRSKTKTLTIKGDVFCELFNINKVDFIKIDVEGLETDVLESFENTIKLNKPVIFCEIYKGTNSNDDPLKTINYLIELGYSAFVLSKGKLNPFISHLDSEYNYFFIPKINI